MKWWMALVLLACSSSGNDASDTGSDSATEDSAVQDTGSDVARDVGDIDCDLEEVVTFSTPDGVELEAFLRGAGAGSPVAVLLHMIPPFNDRSNWPAAFQDELQSQGWTVLNVDRRGAGGSGGTARDAFEGPGGAADVTGAVAFLDAHPCGFDLGTLAILGASNGTTSALDYTVAAAADDRPDPVVLAFLSGGSYTENQNDVTGAMTVPTLFAWGTGDGGPNTWATGAQSDAPEGWSFASYESGAHGTALLTQHPESVSAIAAHLASAR
ncbi:MAG: CocE/NonD family hydrolase [Myxococcota bacterium]